GHVAQAVQAAGFDEHGFGQADGVLARPAGADDQAEQFAGGERAGAKPFDSPARLKFRRQLLERWERGRGHIGLSLVGCYRRGRVRSASSVAPSTSTPAEVSASRWLAMRLRSTAIARRASACAWLCFFSDWSNQNWRASARSAPSERL